MSPVEFGSVVEDVNEMKFPFLGGVGGVLGMLGAELSGEDGVSPVRIGLNGDAFQNAQKV